MNYDLLFSVANTTALLCWLILLVAPRWSLTKYAVISGAAVMVLSLAYLIAVALSLPGSEGDFSSLKGVMRLFEQPGAVLAGWLHYLAFDLFVGLWILQDSRKSEIRHRFIVPVLILTFMLGPVGLLTYHSIKSIVKKRWSYAINPVD